MSLVIFHVSAVCALVAACYMHAHILAAVMFKHLGHSDLRERASVASLKCLMILLFSLIVCWASI